MSRDSQRSKVYIAERAAGLQLPSSTKRDWAMSIEECQQYVNKMLNSAYFKRKYWKHSTLEIRVLEGRNGGRATRQGFGQSVIFLGVWARQEFVIIHEVAHHVAGLSHGHDWRFCEVELDLVRHFMGKEAHDKLKASFKEHKVKFRQPRPKRQLTPEQKAVLVERAAKARAVRQANLAKKAELS